jgi:hypothetical protein
LLFVKCRIRTTQVDEEILQFTQRLASYGVQFEDSGVPESAGTRPCHGKRRKISGTQYYGSGEVTSDIANMANSVQEGFPAISKALGSHAHYGIRRGSAGNDVQ